MKINRIKLTNLHNDAHFRFFTEFLILLKMVPLLREKLGAQIDVWLACYYREDEALKKIRKSSLTEDLRTADTDRDRAFRGLIDDEERLKYND